ncbi:MAG TPA: transketolase [Rudaea sp.]|jgi:transketolase
MFDALDQRCVDTLRFLSVDMVQKADSGHPGLPLGAAPMAYALWQRHLRHNPRNPSWADRDRFVLSAGHGSALLYSLLFMSGYDLGLEDLRQFRQWGSRTPGHPEREQAPGVEMTTGPLGQGFGNAVGMAIGEAQLAAQYNRDGHRIIDHRTFVIASDGDLMEGVASEAASLAGHLQLGKLVVLYDDNRVTLAAGTPITFTEDRAARFRAYGWQAIEVADGNDLEAIHAAIAEAIAETAKPSLILVRTHIGFGSPEQDSFKAHGSPLGEEDVRKTKERLGWPVEPAFLVPDDARNRMLAAVADGAGTEDEWNMRMDAYRAAFPELAMDLERRLRGELPPQWDADIPVFTTDPKGMATREAGGKVLNAMATRVTALTGGSADLDPSTKTAMKGLGDFNPCDAADEQGSCGGGWNYAGRNLHFGVREHAMGAIVNGLAAHGGFIPFGATFLMFSDYMKPTLRLAALMKLHVIHVYTHDSIALGEDGPTHQPVEHLAGLRAIPDLTVLRPADANETAVAWRVAMEQRDRPVLLILSRQAVATLDRSVCASADGLRKGAYVLCEADDGKPQLILIATGAEVGLAVEAATQLTAQGIAVRVVSMPSWDLFELQPDSYRDSVLPRDVPLRLAIEAASPLGWARYVGDSGAVIAVDRFGASAPGAEVLARYGFNVGEICGRARSLMGLPG